MTAILVYSEKVDLARELLTAAAAIAGGSSVKAVVINNENQSKILADTGAGVLTINNENVVSADIAALASALSQVMEKVGADTMLLGSNRRGRELAGRLAQAVGAGCLTDVTAVRLNGDKIECERNAFGGATIATQSITGKKVIAIRAKTFEPAQGPGGSTEDIAVEVTPSLKVREFIPREGETVDLEEADRLVAVGQGLNDKSDLADFEALAVKIGGEVGCSKPLATDKKWLSEERVIGLSGKKCKPQLALLFGISGQVQFTVGIRDSRIIAAINTDENASINYMSDYIIEGDLHEIVKEMNAKL